MEKGARALLFILIGALLVGAVVIALVPIYRQTAFALWRGRPEASAIWSSNRGYYTEIHFSEGPVDDQPQ